MATLTSLCVYCGSRQPRNQSLRRAAQRLGRLVGERGIRLVYGGGHVGLMGVAADAALAAGGEVFGIIPGHLAASEVGHANLTKLEVVDSMHERKHRMFESADAFVILPGGLGTLDEAFEMITWRQLSLHDKPIVLVNQDGYWRPLLNLIDAIVAEDFASVAVRRLFTVVDDVDEVIPAIEKAMPPTVADRPARL
ncbi:TIGR00730 family Rossman fold protein [Oceanibacterium hippocampi]|uniref:Cytokinin riboside 5'-monophosphate phosphoribohydrolase n=1 Tax=Oceanibacterium hippocampi TaxID=745714 RepID=A0A1Y5U265_9PROT|nr:TIGR00730 family Rossman fold protein [Oceanibacterium hippocampi]SLN76844.1 LOG family protein YvdD [Oceanibacterium hippocampi]